MSKIKVICYVIWSVFQGVKFAVNAFRQARYEEVNRSKFELDNRE